MLKRTIEERIKTRIDYKKAIVVMGPRQTGKTTLLRQIASDLDDDFLYINGDDPAIQLLWNNPTMAFINQYIGNNKVIFIDEAQRLSNIGISAKMIIDQMKGHQLFISGSSALEMASTINEPLTGRKWAFELFPFSWNEISEHNGFADTLLNLENYLIYGMYPDVVNNRSEAITILKNLTSSYLYKDILELAGIRKPEVLSKLVQALAFQVGSEVSYNELAQIVGADKATVSNYIDLLENSYVVFRLQPYARNLRNEIHTSRKIYFYDNGIRNAIISRFAPVAQRDDVGRLWENFIISEWVKRNRYQERNANIYYWRTVRLQEIDLVEDDEGHLTGYEIKWNPLKNVRFPKTFSEAYSPKGLHHLHRENFWQFL
jgi:predicted AAA+ superfamily ATPase